MNFWQWLYRAGPGWPTERQWVTIAVFILASAMLQMAVDNPDLWKEELFKTLITVVIVTAIVNAIVAFHFAANKSDEAKTENTAKMADAMKAVAEANTTTEERP